MSEASDQITEYLSVGGLFNPEIMNQTQHEAVRDTLIKARNDIQSLERENAELRTYKANTTIRIAAIEKENAMWVQTVTRLLKEAQSARTAFDAARKEAQQ